MSLSPHQQQLPLGEEAASSNYLLGKEKRTLNNIKFGVSLLRRNANSGNVAANTTFQQHIAGTHSSPAQTAQQSEGTSQMAAGRFSFESEALLAQPRTSLHLSPSSSPLSPCPFGALAVGYATVAQSDDAETTASKVLGQILYKDVDSVVPALAKAAQTSIKPLQKQQASPAGSAKKGMRKQSLSPQTSISSSPCSLATTLMESKYFEAFHSEEQQQERQRQQRGGNVEGRRVITDVVFMSGYDDVALPQPGDAEKEESGTTSKKKTADDDAKDNSDDNSDAETLARRKVDQYLSDGGGAVTPEGKSPMPGAADKDGAATSDDVDRSDEAIAAYFDAVKKRCARALKKEFHCNSQLQQAAGVVAGSVDEQRQCYFYRSVAVMYVTHRVVCGGVCVGRVIAYPYPGHVRVLLLNSKSNQQQKSSRKRANDDAAQDQQEERQTSNIAVLARCFDKDTIYNHALVLVTVEPGGFIRAQCCKPRRLFGEWLRVVEEKEQQEEEEGKEEEAKEGEEEGAEGEDKKTTKKHRKDDKKNMKGVKQPAPALRIKVSFEPEEGTKEHRLIAKDKQLALDREAKKKVDMALKNQKKRR